MGKIQIYRGENILAEVDYDLNTVANEVLNGANKINATFTSLTAVNLMRGDYIYFLDKQYTILDFVDTAINHKYTYEAELLASNYTLLDKPFLNAGGQTVFTVTATVTQFAQMVVDVINTINSGWSLGDVDDDDVLKEITFNADNCRSALGKILIAFELEVYYNGKEINLYKDYRIDDDPIIIEYGGGNGAISISKKTSGDFFTRVIGLGSTRNLPANYRGGKERLTFDPGYADIADAESYVLQKAIEVVFEDIYPTRTGVLTAVTMGTDEILVQDDTIDFNLADNFIDGETALLVLESGNWTGLELEIIKESYNDTYKTFKVRTNKELGYIKPSVTTPLVIGDTYKFIGINLPQSYVDVAEDALRDATITYASVKPTLDITIGVELDPAWILENDLIGRIRVGQPVRVINTPTGIDLELKIISVNRPVAQPEKASIVISDKVQYSEEAQIQRYVVETIKETRVLKENIKEVKAFTARRLDENQSMVFDPMGNYYSEKIAPLSIQTPQLTTGTRAQLLTISNLFRPNWAGNPNSFNSTSGVLNHMTVVPGEVTSWNVTGGTIVGLDPAQPYYIYARCNKANSSGLIVLDQVQRQIESDSTYYYFLIGWISSVTDSGIRYPTLSYGIAELNGQFIKGILTSDDGLSYINLNTGVFAGAVRFLNRDATDYIDANDVVDEAAEALSKATSAKEKTDILKAMAYEDIVELAKLGETVIVGGYLKTTLLDALYIKSNIVNAAYIETLDINSVRGTIGGNEITSNGILGDKFSIIDGKITAIDAEFEDIICIGGTFENITVEGLTATDVEIVGSIKTADGPTGSMFDSDGMYIYNGSYGGVAFRNDGQNTITGSYLDIATQYLKVGTYIGVQTSIGVPKTLDFGGGKSISVINGIIVGAVGF